MGQFSKKQIKNYLEQKQLRAKILDDKYLEEAKTNPLFKEYGKLDDYYKDWIEGSELVAVLPALPEEDPRSQSYYASGNVSAVFMYENNLYSDEDKKRFFLFDSERKKLFSYEKKQYSKEYHTVKVPEFEENIKYFNEHPVVLFFKGCDDGHVGRRFKTKEEAMEYLQLLDVFEDVFEEEGLQYHN